MDTVYFDLETKLSFNDAGGRDRKSGMGMTVGVTYSTADARYEIFPEDRADDLVDRLRRADLVVGFNVIDFDYEVLMGYTALTLQYAVPTLDLLVEVEKSLGRRLKLEAISQATLGVGKIAEGLDAVRWWREGKFEDVAEYCCYDVKVTRMVHEHGLRCGEINYFDRFGQKATLPVAWQS